MEFCKRYTWQKEKHIALVYLKQRLSPVFYSFEGWRILALIFSVYAKIDFIEVNRKVPDLDKTTQVFTVRSSML